MNATQLQTTLAPIVAAIAGFLAGKGYFGWDSQTWIAILGGLGTFAATIWGAIAARKAAIVTTVANLPEVKEVALDAGATGATRDSVSSLNISTPTNVVVK